MKSTDSPSLPRNEVAHEGRYGPVAQLQERDTSPNGTVFRQNVGHARPKGRLSRPDGLGSRMLSITIWDSEESRAAQVGLTPPGGPVGITTDREEGFDVVEEF